MSEPNLRTFSSIPIPYCHGMVEHPLAGLERSRLTSDAGEVQVDSPLSIHIRNGLAYTTGSALGSTPPSTEVCLVAFLTPNKVGLTAGARAWSKHAHRSQRKDVMPVSPDQDPELIQDKAMEKERIADRSAGWWGTPSGPIATINEKALELFWKVVRSASWRNLHWLPNQVLVYEVRVPEGYGMRWSQDQSLGAEGTDEPEVWVFRGFLEPQMENGHEVGWRH